MMQQDMKFHFTRKGVIEEERRDCSFHSLYKT